MPPEASLTLIDDRSRAAAAASSLSMRTQSRFFGKQFGTEALNYSIERRPGRGGGT